MSIIHLLYVKGRLHALKPFCYIVLKLIVTSHLRKVIELKNVFILGGK